MPDKRAHRGPHPDDDALFAPQACEGLREATNDLSWLLGRGYTMVSALKLVGDRFQLVQRQRLAVMRSACSDEACANRSARRIEAAALDGRTVRLDGYNVLTSVEAALGGGVILLARDGCVRDMASMHGTYRKVAETIPALQLIGEYLSAQNTSLCHWYLDSPVSNSGRLKTIMLDVASRAGWNWQVELIPNPDTLLADSKDVIASADSVILDRCARWVNLAREVIQLRVPIARIVDLSNAEPSS